MLRWSPRSCAEPCVHFTITQLLPFLTLILPLILLFKRSLSPTVFFGREGSGSSGPTRFPVCSCVLLLGLTMEGMRHVQTAHTSDTHLHAGEHKRLLLNNRLIACSIAPTVVFSVLQPYHTLEECPLYHTESHNGMVDTISCSCSCSCDSSFMPRAEVLISNLNVTGLTRLEKTD